MLLCIATFFLRRSISVNLLPRKQGLGGGFGWTQERSGIIKKALMKPMINKALPANSASG
jgi:hypothetical protein